MERCNGGTERETREHLERERGGPVYYFAIRDAQNREVAYCGVHETSFS